MKKMVYATIFVTSFALNASTYVQSRRFELYCYTN